MVARKLKENLFLPTVKSYIFFQSIFFFVADGNAGITTLQLYAAGTETTSTALRWALLFMCLYPEVQDKVHKEVDKTIGRLFRQFFFKYSATLLQ